MASPFPKYVELGENAKIREGITLRDYRKDHPDGKILPSNGERNVLITSALPYVNNQPHLGNIIGSTLSADVFARYSRQRNHRTLYICGTDEYGTTTEVMAAKEGLTPQEICDKYNKLHAEAYEWFEIGFDHFGRTSAPKQTELAQDIFLKLYQNGWFERNEREQLYCEKDERFLADRYVEGTCPKPGCGATDARGDQCDLCSGTYESPLELINPRCSACGTAPALRTTAHLNLKLHELQPQVEKFVRETSAKGHWSSNGKAFTDGWLKGGLKSRSMTRDLKWGVKLPEELGEEWKNKVMYVWFDAPIGYPSITAAYTDEWKQWWRNPENVELSQFMGKDNVPFHAVLFPAYLIGTNDPWTMLTNISTTEYLQYEGTKFSKSKNVGVFGSNARETGIPAAVWRYYLLANRPESSDSEFTWDDFVTKANSELLNNLGNFVNRMIKFVIAKFDSVLPDPKEGQFDYTKEAYPFSEQDQGFVSDINALLKQYTDYMDAQKIRQGLVTMMAISGRGNQFIQDNEVNNATLAADPKRVYEVVLLTINLIYTLSALIHPFMPSTSDSILDQLQATPRVIPDSFSVDLFPGHKIGQATHLFSRIDPKNVEKWRAQYGGAAAAQAAEEAPKLSKKQQDKLRKAQQKAAAELAAQTPRTPEQEALEARIKQQGDVVKAIKGGEKVEGKGGIDEEVQKLKGLKGELEELTKRLAGVSVQVGPAATA